MIPIFYYIILNIRFIIKHSDNPTTVGSSIAIIVHFILFVSFLIVRHVVPHGKWHNENIIVHSALQYVQPFSMRSIFNDEMSRFVSFDSDIYAIIAIGITISFAGNPSIKASNITPSNPNNFANGSRVEDNCFKRDISFMYMFESNHMIIPMGAATIIALPKTFNVLSKIDLTITFPICGFLNGGNSNTNDEGIPFNIVLDSILDIISVIMTDSAIKENRIIVDFIDEDAKNIVISVIIVGNLPLHGMKLLVSIAISLSLFESIILAPTTPQALHPNPIHIVKDCFP